MKLFICCCLVFVWRARYVTIYLWMKRRRSPAGEDSLKVLFRLVRRENKTNLEAANIKKVDIQEELMLGSRNGARRSQKRDQGRQLGDQIRRTGW